MSGDCTCYVKNNRDTSVSCGKEKLEAELLVAEKKLEMEKAAVSNTTKLPKLKITPFKGAAGDSIRFENMFMTQADAKSISDEEKFGYLLQSVSPKVRDRIANLKLELLVTRQRGIDKRKNMGKQRSS